MNFFAGLQISKFSNYCRLPSEFSSKFQSSMTIFHHMLTREGRVLAIGSTQPSPFTLIVHTI